MSQSNKTQIQKTVKAITNCQESNFNFLKHSENFFDIDKKHLLDINNLYFPNNQLDEDLKAYADLSCCYYLFHDQENHQKLLNEFRLIDEETIFFEALEKIRISLLSKEYYLGIFKNILTKFSRDLNLVSFNDRAIMLQILLIGKYLENHQIIIDDYFEEIYFQTKQDIKQNILEKIDQLTKKISDQNQFSKISCELIKSIKQDDLKNEEEGIEEKQPQNNDNDQKNQENEQNSSENHQESPLEEQTEQETSQHEPEKEKNSASLENNQSMESKAVNNKAQEDIFPSEEDSLEFYLPYKIYTSNFDEVIIPTKLIEKHELEKLKNLLDSKIDKLDNISKKLRLEFRKKLLSKQNVTFKQSQDEEIIDKKKLTQIIASPFKKNFYITNKHQQYQNTVITILLDNSGSMRGSPIVILAMACEIIAQLLEEFSIKTEILGFTTADWRGGKSKKLWEENNKPENPGRLNDLRHIIYKSANQSFKKSKNNLGLMLKEGILKENIDGEAILWAKSRLMQMPEERKILMIISDGTPVDDPTNTNNDKEILIDHLHHVINKIEKDNKIELVGIGIGHDVGSYYNNYITIKNPEELGDVMIKKIIDLV